MKLYIDKKQCDHHVDCVIDSGDNLKNDLAHFQSHRKRKNGCFGIVRLRHDSPLTTVVHELVHVAMHFVEFYTDRKIYDSKSEDEQYEYMCEASAHCVEFLLKQYMESAREK